MKTTEQRYDGPPAFLDPVGRIVSGPPCDCGAPAEACRWHGSTRRVYACDACYRASRRRSR